MSRLVPIACDLTLPEALVLRSMLQARGIFVHLDTFYHVAMAWHLSQALHGLRINVASQQAEDALQLIAAHDANAAQDTQESVPSMRQGLTRALFAVAIWSWTGMPCPYWTRKIRPG